LLVKVPAPPVCETGMKLAVAGDVHADIAVVVVYGLSPSGVSDEL
jgi:hypothetical protein